LHWVKDIIFIDVFTDVECRMPTTRLLNSFIALILDKFQEQTEEQKKRNQVTLIPLRTSELDGRI